MCALQHQGGVGRIGRSPTPSFTMFLIFHLSLGCWQIPTS